MHLHPHCPAVWQEALANASHSKMSLSCQCLDLTAPRSSNSLKNCFMMPSTANHYSSHRNCVCHSQIALSKAKCQEFIYKGKQIMYFQSKYTYIDLKKQKKTAQAVFPALVIKMFTQPIPGVWSLSYQFLVKKILVEECDLKSSEIFGEESVLLRLRGFPRAQLSHS